ncbi:MAG: FtsB family cell division protein [Acidobacteriaceae bacterium]
MGWEPSGQAEGQRNRVTRRVRMATAAYAQRRRVASIFAVALAVLLAYHVVVGTNGLSSYAAKRTEHRALATQIQQLQQENGRLKEHVDHLKSDPNAIEAEAHKRLRYARPGQVIVLNDDVPAADARH